MEWDPSPRGSHKVPDPVDLEKGDIVFLEIIEHGDSGQSLHPTLSTVAKLNGSTFTFSTTVYGDFIKVDERTGELDPGTIILARSLEGLEIETLAIISSKGDGLMQTLSEIHDFASEIERGLSQNPETSINKLVVDLYEAREQSRYEVMRKW